MASKFKEANKFILDGFLDAFGREFCKHEVLWKPKPNCKEFEIQSGTHVAHGKLAQALNMSVEAVLELLETFPAACLNLISRYELRRKIDVGCRMPDWLTLLAGQSRLLKNSTKYMKSAVYARYDLVRALCESARVGLGAGSARAPADGTDNGMEDEAPPLWGPRAVANFVARHGVREEEVLPAWRSVLELCVVKLRAVLATGDRLARLPFALRPTAAERALIDLALLHDARVSQIVLLTPAKLRTLVLLFQLIVAAKETYDAGGGAPGDRYDRDGVNGEDNTLSRLDSVGGKETCAPTSGANDGAPETADSSRITEATLSRLDSAIEELSVERLEPRSARNLLRETVVERATKRQFDDEDYVPVEETSDDELHKELDQEPEIHVISSDTSDCEISNKYFEESPKDNKEVPVLLDEGRVEKSVSDIMEKNTLIYRERESYISSRSQNSDTKSKYCYEESESNSSEERKAVWAMVYTDFKKRGRSASLISLQHRWVELLHLARVALLTACSSEALVDRNVHPLLLVVAHWFPEIVTENLPSWNSLVLERKIVLESDIKDIINKYRENDNVLLNVTENLTFPDLLKKYVTKNVIDPHGHTKSNATNKHLSYQTDKENTCSIINNTDTNNTDKENTSSIINNLEQSQAQDNAINNESNVNNCISTMLDQIDPTKAKISIIIDEDSEEDVEEGNTTTYDNSVSHETTPYLNNLNVSKSDRRATILREENNHIPMTVEKVNELTEITMKNIEKELEDKLNYINNTDEKLVNPARIVLTPIEHLPEWKKHSRNGVIKCRKFSVKNFTKPVIATSIQLSKCATNVNNNKNNSEEYESENYMNNEVRIKFEDDGFETDFSFGDDINNGIKYQKYIELYNMPDHLRKNRIKLTRTLKLSRTYFTLNFWSLDSNIELMKLCKPMAIKLSKVIPRVAKRVELSDINEVRRINRSILTAQVSPTVGTPAPHAQRSSTSQEVANFTNNSMSSNSDTTRQTNNCLSSDLDSTELLNRLTNYVIQTKISKESVIEPVRKDITLNSNLMDSIIDTMRLADKNISQHSTVSCTLNSLQQSSLSSSDTSEVLLESNISKNISATHTFSTTQKSTEEVRNNLKLKLSNNSLLGATSTIHISSNCTKQLYIKHVQRNNINSTSLNLVETVLPNVVDLKDMILYLVNRFDTTMRHEYSMKINRSSLNLHLKNFEKQLRGFVKNISKLSKILPQYVLKIKLKRRVTKNPTAQNKRKKVNRIKWKESKDHSTIPSSNTYNSADIANNINSTFVDDDCEPNLVIDERSLELSDKIYLNKLQCYEIDTNKNIQETCNIRKNDMKEKHKKKAKKRSRQSKKILEKEKPMLNEYQEWHRQKTMALKYFTIPMSDTSKQTSKVKITQQHSTMTKSEQQSNVSQTTIPIKRKNTEDIATMSTELQSNGSQTTIPIKRKNTEDIATTSTELQSNGSQTTIPIKRKNTEDIATTSTELQSNGSQTTIPIKRKNTEDIATTSTELQSNGSQTTIPIKRKNTEDIATTSTELQSNGSQTTIPIKRKNTEDIATTSTELQSNGSQTTIPIKRKNTEDIATTSTELQSNGSQTTIPIKRKNTEDIATTSTELQSNGSQTTIPIKRKNTEDIATTSTELQGNGSQTTIPIKRKNTEDIATTSTELQGNGSQTTIPIKRKNTEDIATTSTVSDITKRPKFHSNESNVVYISDSSSDYDEQISKYYIAQDRNDSNPNTTRPDIHQIDKTENANKVLIFNDILQKQAVNQNVCVINAPVAISTPVYPVYPVYVIINDTQLPTATQDAINKTQDSETINNPEVFQVLSNVTSYPTLTQIVPQNMTQQNHIVVMNEKCTLTNKCKCIKCENTLRDDILTCTLDFIQNITHEDSRNNAPSTSLQQENDHLIKEAITVKEYLSANKNLTALIKVDGSQKLLFFCSKYIILTDVNIPSNNATYRVSIKIKNKKKLSRVLVPNDIKGSILLLGQKNESECIYCQCLKGKRLKCNLCQRIKDNVQNPTNLLKIDSDYYKRISQKPNKYVRLNENELKMNSRAVLEGIPDLILVNKMFFKKLSDSPAKYVRILSAPQDAATLRHLVRKDVLLYVFDVTLSQNCFTPLVYTRTAGHVTVHHSDKKLAKVLQWIFN